MARRRRTPTQTLVVMLSMIAGLWLCLWVADLWRDDGVTVAAEHLPDIELVDVAPERIRALGDGEWRVLAPSSESVSLRQYAVYRPDPDGRPTDNGFVIYLRQRLAPEDVNAERYPMLARPARRRSRDELPPDWFPLVADQDRPWRTPAWWKPQADSGVGLYEAEAGPEGQWLGQYLHYDRGSGWFHLWQWRRLGVEPPPSPLQHLVVDLLAQDLARVLIARQHPADADGWLLATGLTPALFPQLADSWPPSLQRIDSCLLPLQDRHRYLLVLSGIDEVSAEALLGELPMRRLPDDAPPPNWTFAAPRSAAGVGPPSWFDPGAGPRWGYALLRPRDGLVETARWAAYDRAARQLAVWDWQAIEARPPTTDPTR